MMVRADVKCYFCGHLAGEVEGEYAAISRRHTFHAAAPSDERAVRPNGTLRCPRCDGPVFLEGIEHLRVRQPRPHLTAADFVDFKEKKAS